MPCRCVPTREQGAASPCAHACTKDELHLFPWELHGLQGHRKLGRLQEDHCLSCQTPAEIGLVESRMPMQQTWRCVHVGGALTPCQHGQKDTHPAQRSQMQCQLDVMGPGICY